MKIKELDELVFSALCGTTKARDSLKQWLDENHGRVKELTESGLVLTLEAIEETTMIDPLLPRLTGKLATLLEHPPKSETPEREWLSSILVTWTGLLSLALHHHMEGDRAFA